MGNSERRIFVKLGGPATKAGRVSVGLLTKTLGNIQQTLFQIGKFELEKDPSKRSPATEIQRACELFLVEAKPGSLEATLELPSREATLFPMRDLGKVALGHLNEVIEGITSDSPQQLKRTLPNPRYRKRVVEILSGVMPPEGADYNLQIRVGPVATPTILTRPPRDRLKELVGVVEEPTPELAHEATIQARCRAKVTEEGELEDILEVLDFDLIDIEDLRPYRPDEIVWGERIFFLHGQIACGIEIEEGLWIIEYEPLGIRASGGSHEDAIAEFSEEFAMLWDEYARTAEEELTEDAVALKQHIGKIVREVKKK